jgi:predicted lipid carrier protein YhbT
MCGKVGFKVREGVLRLLLYIFVKGMIFLSRTDKDFKSSLEELPDGFTFCLNINYTNMKVCMSKSNGTLTVVNAETSDLELIFINPCSAFLVFSGIMPQHEAFAQRRIKIKGDLADALILMGAMKRLQLVLFPYFISKRLVRGSLKKDLNDNFKMIGAYLSLLKK